MADATDGFQAFPSQDYFGMSLRDYFAGQALTVLAGEYDASASTAATLAYKMADAMLMERKK
jgi:hypothetical protein